MKTFAHLHVHSHYSLLTALPRIKELVNAAKNDNMPALALTDNGNLYGAIEFYQACKQAEIKPILGIDAYLAPRTRRDKEPRIDSRRSRLVFLAKNYSGYKNLIKMVSDSYLEGFYYKPRIDKELIEKYRENLICISPFFNSEISNALKMEDFEKAKNFINYYKNIFDQDFYLEILHHPEIEGMTQLKNNLIKLAKETETKMVACHDVYYMHPDDRKARDTLVSVQSSFGSKDAGSDSDNEDFSFIDQKTANEYFADLPEALDSIQEIIDKCDIEITLGKWKFPNYIIESGLSADDELRRLAEQGIKYRGFTDTPDFRKRFEYELEVIATKGYSKYFLVVADMLKYAKDNEILTNTRGSAAGSLISYLIEITTVNPIDLNLPFERFLNPERPSAPDVDMDFADDKRDLMIEYVRQKYGHEHVAQIGTFGTMLARGSVRDVARAMGFEYSKGDQISKLIPMGSQGFPMTIERALTETPELAELYKTDSDTKTIIDMARKIEGCARHIGVHAAGVVISPDPLTDDVPIQFDPKGEGKLITQYDMHAVGEDGVGLLKFDFLGLKNLTIMGRTIKLAKILYDIEIDIDNIPLNDKKTYEMLARGETAATFQLNGAGMTRFLKELKPNSIHDINAMVALYRPGPMDFIPDYIERKHNPNKAKYIDDRFKNILEKTFGILIYQDDIMIIAVDIAGYSWGEADKFRKAMGKKIPEVMREQKEKFSKGCMDVGGLTEKDTQALWESIETFAAYGFNKAHAASYGRVAYLTSYLKANYPVLYMAAVLTSDQGDTEKVAEMINECKRMNINVLPPDINESFEDFTVVKNAENNSEEIRFGLTTIKNFGEGIAHEIIEEREKNGNFQSLEDFITRIHSRSFNKKSLEALIKTGALDKFGDRGSMLSALENLLSLNKEIQKSDKDQTSLFGEMTQSEMPKIKLDENARATDEEKLAWEKELLGLFISGHPLDKFKEKFSNPKNQIINIKKSFVPPKPLAEGEKIDWRKKRQEKLDTKVVAGMIETIRIIKTKKNEDMAFVKIADLTDFIEVVFFPGTFLKYKDILKETNCIAIKGSLSERNGEISMLADQIKMIT
jgi:DNA polymerase III subunit alpha